MLLSILFAVVTLGFCLALGIQVPDTRKAVAKAVESLRDDAAATQAVQKHMKTLAKTAVPFLAFVLLVTALGPARARTGIWSALLIAGILIAGILIAFIAMENDATKKDAQEAARRLSAARANRAEPQPPQAPPALEPAAPPKPDPPKPNPPTPEAPTIPYTDLPREALLSMLQEKDQTLHNLQAIPETHPQDPTPQAVTPQAVTPQPPAGPPPAEPPFPTGNIPTPMHRMFCLACKGSLQKKPASYKADTAGGTLTILMTPAQVCRTCGKAYYDADVEQRLQAIAAAHAGDSGSVFIDWPGEGI